ncbi:MAG: hypothetical protein IT320_05675 [Anaerolineae bacterium]|nr:hypothetical protein [Anaerolineae bacterium]
MIARKIWLALRQPPPKNPIFEFALKSNRDQLSLPVIRLITFAMAALIFATLCFFLITGLTATGFPRVLGVIPIIFGFVLILSTTVDGGMWAMRVADGIAFHRHNRQWDVLAVTPPGETGVVWALCQGTFQRWGLLRRGIRSIKRSLLIFSLIAALLMVPAIVSGTLYPEYLLASIQVGLMLAIFYFDYLHSVSCAALSGMLGAQVVSKRTEAQLLSYTIFQVAQIIVYTWSILVILLIARLYPNRSLLDGWNPVAQTLMTILLVLMVVLVREGACRLLWYMMRRRLDETGSWQNGLPLA